MKIKIIIVKFILIVKKYLILCGRSYFNDTLFLQINPKIDPIQSIRKLNEKGI